jgi:hypothetical protein
MAVSSFEDFCASLSGLMGVDPPPLQPDDMGAVGFTVIYRDARIGFMRADFGADPGLLMMVEFGAPPPEQELQILRHLLDANFLMGGMGAPAFERDPATGEISLRHSFLLSQVSVQGVFQDIADAAEAVANWRESHFLEAPAAHAVPDNARVGVANLA